MLNPVPGIGPWHRLLRRFVRRQHHVLRAIAVGVDPHLPSGFVALDDLLVEDVLRAADAADVVWHVHVVPDPSHAGRYTAAVVPQTPSRMIFNAPIRIQSSPDSGRTRSRSSAASVSLLPPFKSAAPTM